MRHLSVSVNLPSIRQVVILLFNVGMPHSNIFISTLLKGHINGNFLFLHLVAINHSDDSKIDNFNTIKSGSNMKIQIIQDSKGKATGVYIPISEWKELKKQFKDLEALEHEEPTKEQILQELKEAVNELKLVEQGKLKARPAKELLDEL